jgi:hypothetical protein
MNTIADRSTRQANLMYSANEAFLQGQLMRSEQLLTEALSTVEDDQSLSHPYVGECFVNLGNIRMLVGSPDEAESLYRLAAYVYRRALGDEHPNVFLTFKKVAQACRAQGHFAMSREVMEAARALDDPRKVTTVMGLKAPTLDELKAAGTPERITSAESRMPLPEKDSVKSLKSLLPTALVSGTSVAPLRSKGFSLVPGLSQA